MVESLIEGYHLSPQQKQLWLLQEPGYSHLYCAQCAVLVEGSLDASILELALQDVVNRHEILRTNFRALQGMDIPLQIINDCEVATVSYYNFADLSPAEQKIKIETLFYDTSQQTFDLGQDSLLNISLFALPCDVSFS